MKRSFIKLIAVLLVLVSVFTVAAFANDTETEDTTVTFGVFSDIHKNEVPLQRVMDDLITMAEGRENIDGLALVGDIVYFQKNETPDGSYYNVLDENENYKYFADKGVVAFTMGNHEFPLDCTIDDPRNALSFEVFEEETGYPAQSHRIIGGYHFITGAPGAYNGIMTAEQEQYVMDEITEALEDGEDKPIFVLIHHPVDDTLYNTTDRGRNSDEFVEFLKSQPRVVVFSGHNHYSISNPRAIRQYPGGATFLYTSSVHSGNKMSDPYATQRHDTSYPSQAYLMEIDSATNIVTLKRFYVTINNTPTWIEGGDWVLDIPKMVAESEKAEGETIDLDVYKYTYEEREENSVAPRFGEGDAIKLNSVSTKDVSITFPEATAGAEGEDNMVGYYKVDIINKATSETVFTAKYISDYFKQQSRRTSFSYTYTDLSYETEYTIKVTPVNMWYVEGTPITADFKTGGLPGGFGTIVGYDSSYYAAPAVLDVSGDKLKVDADAAFIINDENNKRLAGLYAVSKDNTFATYEVTYVYGEYNTRKTFVRKWATDETNPVTGSVIGSAYVGRIKCVNADGFYPGVFGGVGSWSTMKDPFYDNELSSYGEQISYKATRDAYFYSRSWDTAIEEAKTLAGSDETALATYLANLESFYGKYYKADSHSEFIDTAAETAYNTARSSYLGALITKAQAIKLKYAFSADQIVPISEVNSLSYTQRNKQGYLSYKENVAAKIIAYVIGENGLRTTHTAYTTAAAVDGTFRSRSINFETATFTPALPDSGYLVGFELYPLAGITDPDKITTTGLTPKNCLTATNTYALRVRFGGTYSIDTPQVPKPDYLSVDENGKLMGAAEGTVYMYAPLKSGDMLHNKTISYKSVNADTVFEKGLYAVKVLGIEGECTDSEPYILFVSGTAAEQKDIGNLDDSGRVNAGTALKDLRFSNTENWVDGSWTGDVGTSIATQYWRSYYFVMAHSHMSASYTAAIRNANEQTLLTAQNEAAKIVKNIHFKYSYEGKEVLPVSFLGQIGFYTEKNLGAYDLPDEIKSEVILYVLNEDLTVTEYSAMVDHKLESDTFVKASAFNLPKKGYIIGIEVYPYKEYDATKATVGTSTYNNRWAFEFNPKNYIVKTVQETPTLTVSSNYTQLTVGNFKSGTTYAYSTDNGESWTEFTTKTLKFTQANKYYRVKALGDDVHFESEIATPQYPSAAAVFKGASLILDGRIGVRIYFDLDKSAAKFTGIKFKKSNETRTTDLNLIGSSWSKSVDYTDDGRTGYITAYISPKNYDDVTVSVTQLIVANNTPGMSSKSITDTIPAISVKDYIKSFYNQVEAGNEACIAANGLVMALEAYCKNADNFFSDSDALAEVAADTTAIQNITNPKKTTTYTENAPIEHHSTSLILEDTVTIRHYFKINDEKVLEGLTSNMAGFSVENIKTSESGTKYLWVDVTDIDAANLDTRYTATLTDSNGGTVTVTYSALNYVKQTYNSTEPKLKNISRAIFNYSQEAEKYNK